jgi:UDP-N-acetylglucosamine acyltransferase
MIHPTAYIDPLAKIAPDVRIGPMVVIEGPVTIGPGCILHPRAHLIGPLTMGARNVVHGGAVLGDWPQDRKYHGEFSQVIIGDDNVFRENCTVHRGTGENTKTIVGNGCYLFAQSHVGHNCVVGNEVMLVNGAALGGFVQVGDKAIVGGNCCVHQFSRVGRLAMLSNVCAATQDIPPFFISMRTNKVCQLNRVGVKRAGIPLANLNGLRKMVQLVFRSGRPLGAAFADLPREVADIPEVREVAEFVRTTKRGVARYQSWANRGKENDEEE